MTNAAKIFSVSYIPLYLPCVPEACVNRWFPVLLHTFSHLYLEFFLPLGNLRCLLLSQV